MKKWELARYLIDAKKCVDSILFIAESIKDLRNLNIRDIVDDRLRKFYINVKVVYDKSLPLETRKQLAKTDEIYKKTCLERDKNYAHKDENYLSSDFDSLLSMANLLKWQLNHCFALCKDSLPDKITLDYIDYDRDLYRFIHKIDYEKEEEIMKAQHPEYGKSQYIKQDDIIGVRKVFNDTEEMRKIDNPDDYAVILKVGLTIREGIQEQQDGFIKINVLSGTDIWPIPNMEVIKEMKQLLEECPDLPFLY